MGSGGSGTGGAGGSGGGYNSNGWGGTMGSGGNAYSGGGVGGIGTAGTMSSGAGGSAMGGFGNTGAGGSGMAGISTHSGETPAGFTPSAGDPRGTSLGMDAFGNYKGSPGYAGIGSATANRATTMTPKAQMEMFGYVKYPSNPPKVTAPKTFSTPIPTQTTALLAPKTFFGQYGPPPSAPVKGWGIHPNQVNPGYGYSPGMKGPFSVGGNNTAQGYQGVNPGLRDRSGVNPGTAGSGPRGYSGGAYGNTQGPVGGRRS